MVLLSYLCLLPPLCMRHGISLPSVPVEELLSSGSMMLSPSSSMLPWHWSFCYSTSTLRLYRWHLYSAVVVFTWSIFCCFSVVTAWVTSQWCIHWLVALDHCSQVSRRSFFLENDLLLLPSSVSCL